MQAVTLTFRSGQTKQFKGPESWDEITPGQFRQWVRATQLGNGDADAYALLTIWYGIGYRTLRKLDAEQRLRLLDLLAFTQTRPSRWMIPLVSQRGTLFDGPGDRLGNLTFGQFMRAEAARQRENLPQVAEALYKPRYAWRWGGRFRPPDDDGQAILFNYLGCLENLPTRFPHVFRPAKSEETPGGTWLDVGLGLARQTGALGTFKQIEESNLYLVLPVLEGLIRESEELEKQTEKLRRGQ